MAEPYDDPDPPGNVAWTPRPCCSRCNSAVSFVHGYCVLPTPVHLGTAIHFAPGRSQRGVGIAPPVFTKRTKLASRSPTGGLHSVCFACAPGNIPPPRPAC